MAEGESDDVIHLNMIKVFKKRLIDNIQMNTLLDHMISLDKEFKQILRSTALASDVSAAEKLIDRLLEGPREPGWFQEFVNALAQSENFGAGMYVSNENLPSPEKEAKQDNCEKLINYLYPTLVKKLKPGEISILCLINNLCSAEDLQIVSINMAYTEGRLLLGRVPQ